MSLMDKMQNDRIALIIFAGRAYLKMPLTVDYSAVKMLLQSASPDMVPTQGTVIGDAIEMATKSFSQNERKYKSLILITDGEDHDESAIEKTRAAAEEGVIVHKTRSVKLDENGQPVVSKLNEEELRAIASAGHGTYSLLQNTDDVAGKLTGELDRMEQKNLGALDELDPISYFQYFLLAGLIILILEWLIPGAKKVKNNKYGSIAS
jgi:Ca-activated chloride channel family protein